MLVSWNWLSDFVNLDGLDPAEVGDRLTLAGLELEGIHTIGSAYDHVVVAEVVELQPHPDADKLNVCQVNDGSGDLVQVVCGAPNVRIGMRVPFARVGAVLPGDFAIKDAKLRGVDSFGMLCSADELGVTDSIDGLFELATDAPIGTEIGPLLGLNDIVLDIALTPNRPDCLSIRGVAREVAALYGVEFRPSPDASNAQLPTLSESAADIVSIIVEDGERCPRYAAAIIRGVDVGPSPVKIQARLLAVGQRPINNLVDMTNYLNLGYGQPLHAFNLANIAGNEIRVRDAKPGEIIVTLDEKERRLEGGELLICDGEKPIALAGVMGGANSDIKAEHCDVLIECANFSPEAIRPTSRRLKLHTDASHRYERGVDSALVGEVIELAIQHVFETLPAGSGAKRAKGLADAKAREPKTWTVTMPAEMPSTILGARYEREESIAALRALGLGVEEKGEDLVVSVDERRPDLTRPIDIVEEVGRVIGFERMPSTFPTGLIGYEHTRRENPPVPQRTQPIVSEYRLDLIERIRQTCADAGIYEAVTWSLVATDDVTRVTGKPPALKPNNALSSEADALRSSLLPGLLRSVLHNRSRHHHRVPLFELGTCFLSDDLTRDDRERQHLCAVLAGPRSEAWHASSEEFDVHDVVGVLEQLGQVTYRPFVMEVCDSPLPWMHPNACAQIRCGDEIVGHVAEVHPGLLSELDIAGRVAAFELDVDAWLEIPEVARSFTVLSRTFGSTRDVALLVDRNLPYQRVHEALVSFDEPLLAEHALFDVYVGEGVSESKKSLALTLTYRQLNNEKSLKDKHVEKAHARVVDHLREVLDAETR